MSKASLPALPCLCANFRRASRALTQRYDDALRPLGLTITQFTILQAVSLTGEVSQRKLGETLAMDSTTLTRTLDIMRRHSWIAVVRGADRRERRLSLSPGGKAEFAKAVPAWQSAQAGVRAQMGKRRWKKLIHLSNEVTSMVGE